MKTLFLTLTMILVSACGKAPVAPPRSSETPPTATMADLEGHTFMDVGAPDPLYTFTTDALGNGVLTCNSYTLSAGVATHGSCTITFTFTNGEVTFVNDQCSSSIFGWGAYIDGAVTRSGSNIRFGNLLLTTDLSSYQQPPN